MDKDSRREPRHALKTARAIADPVLIRMTHDEGEICLLADDVIYEQAGSAHLLRVCWVRMPRGIRAALSLQRGPVNGFIAELRLRRSQSQVFVLIPQWPTLRVPEAAPHYCWRALSRQQYLELRALSPRRLAIEARALTEAPPARSQGSLAESARRVMRQTQRILRATPRRLALALARI